jgi:translation initiation factor 2B subunit (eIF-2B alpha/beta/delta family)
VLASAAAHVQLEVADLQRLVGEEAESLVDGRRRAGASIAIQLRERLEDAVVLTHSASATVREALLHTPPAHVICTVSSPQDEGRAFAEDLRSNGLEVELVEDDEAPAKLEWASVLLLGADTVYHDGTLCNKTGTSALAEAAAAASVPVIVACEVIKLAPSSYRRRWSTRWSPRRAPSRRTRSAPSSIAPRSCARGTRYSAASTAAGTSSS